MVDSALIRRLTAFVAAAALALGTLGVAAAAELEADDVQDDDTPHVVVDLEGGTLTIGLPLDGDLPACDAGVEDGTDVATEDDPTVAGEGDDDAPTFAPGDCVTLEFDHPSGKTHHGAVVSTVAKQLHPSMLDGLTKGEIMREIAKIKHVDAAEHSADPEDGASQGGPPAHAKDKSAKGKNGNGNGNGKANGKNK